MERWLFANKDRVVQIDWSCGDEVIVSTISDPPLEVGRVAVSYLEKGAFGEDSCWMVVGARLDGPDSSGQFLRKGIAREIVRTLGQELLVTFPLDFGHGPNIAPSDQEALHAFAAQMIGEGLASWEQ